jgi:hypothetical protein
MYSNTGDCLSSRTEADSISTLSFLIIKIYMIQYVSEDITFLYYIQVQKENTVFCLPFDNFLVAQELPTLR